VTKVFLSFDVSAFLLLFLLFLLQKVKNVMIGGHENSPGSNLPISYVMDDIFVI